MRSKFADEPMDFATLDRVKVLGADAERVVRAYLRLEGALHQIEELSDADMKDGDGARDIAKSALRGD